MSTAARVLELARAELGTVESPPGSNRTPYADRAGHLNGYAWCATFVVAVMRAAGITLPSESAYTPTMAAGFRKAGRWSGTPAVGAVVFYTWPSMGRIAHNGIVERVLADGIVAIEGNTDAAGGRTGGRVMRQLRRANITGYGMPAYADQPAPAPAPPRPAAQPAPPFPLPRGWYFGPRSGPRESVSGYHGNGHHLATWQGRMRARGWDVGVDGRYGPNTADVARRFQRGKGLAVDGLIGPATWAAAWTAPVT